MNTPREIGTHPYYGRIVVTDYGGVGAAYPLTPCCGASAKGLEDGVGCRSCYQIIEDKYGMGWRTDSPAWEKVKAEIEMVTA